MIRFAVYNAATGLVVGIGHCSNPDDVALHALPGQVADVAAPADVTADGRWAMTSAGYVQNAAPAPSAAQLSAYAAVRLDQILSAMRDYTSGATTIKSDATSATLTDWLALQQWASANPAGTTQWVANDGTVAALPAAAIAPIAFAVGGFAQTAWQDFAAIVTAIGAGTITTLAQIDAAAWPT